MKIDRALEMVTELYTKHDLFKKGWGFEFDKAKRRFGCCNYSTGRISLSLALVELNSEERVRNTLLHEIAHALVGHGHGHDRVWRNKALEIGCDGNRCYSSEDVQQPTPNYQAVCNKCGTKHNRQRLPRKDSSCGICSNKFDKNLLLKFKKV